MSLRNWHEWTTSLLTERSSAINGVGIIISLLLIHPLISMEPSQQASPNPPGEVYDLQEEIDQKFPTPLHFAYFILEARNGDVLTKEVLLEFKRNRTRLIDLDENGSLSAGTLEKQSYLFSYYDPDLGREVTGVNSILDAIEIELSNMKTSLELASEENLKISIHRALNSQDTEHIIDFLSRHASSTDRFVDGQHIEWWISPAMTFFALADNSKLGGSGLEIGIGGGPDVINKEHLNRRISGVMRGQSLNYEMWGVAIDANLESADEGKTAGIYLMFTVIGAVLVVGLSLKSYWATVISGVGLGILMIWLKGISALIGIKAGIVIDLVVPIGMISLGVDFVVHSVRRYKEEINNGNLPKHSLRLGFTSILGVLILAMLSDSIAFLSNLSSSIEAVMHFGSAAGIGVLSSFLVLGIWAPVMMMRIDEKILQSDLCGSRLLPGSVRILGSLGAAVSSGLSVIMLVAVSKLLGVLLLLTTIFVFILVPLAVMFVLVLRMRPISITRRPKEHLFVSPHASRIEKLVERIVLMASTNHIYVIALATVGTFCALYFALKLTPTFDVKDFFDSESEFVVGLDKMDHHVGDRGGEPGVAYIKGNLMNPDGVLAISRFVEALYTIENVAETLSGEVTIGFNVLNISNMIVDNRPTIIGIESSSGILVTDSNNDGIPDTQSQMEAAFKFVIKNGILGDDGNLILSPDQVRGAVYLSKDGEGHLTTVTFLIPGTRDRSIVKTAGDAVDPLLETLEANASITKASLTGSPFTRHEQLAATTRTLYTSLPIAGIAVMILLLFVMRSVRYAIVTVIPILLVVVWLYGLMYIAGFSLNFVTAMIGAISIGIGIDYSIYMTERFKEELQRSGIRIEAIKRSATGTGVALVAAAASSIVGFTIMGFAPMPMFSSYGQLTAVMIMFALLASLIVLPALLMLVTTDKDIPSLPIENQ